MSQPESKEPSKMKKLLNGGNGDSNESPLDKLKRSVGTNTPPQPQMEAAPNGGAPTQVETLQPSQPQPIIRTRGKAGDSRFTAAEWKFLPAFWTIASIMSIVVNIVLLIIVAILWQNLNTVGVTVTGISDQLLGGLYNNFVKMDNATIRTQIPVNANIPLSITVPVRTTTQITLAEAAVIRNAHVVINTGSVNINADATVTLPANTPLTVNLDFALPVQDTIPISLLVDVNIPLKSTELSEPFNGLQDVVRPYYCLIKPDATSIIDNSFVCSQNP
jgi:hypothetical protein